MDKLEAWLRLNRAHLSPKRQLALLEALGSPEAILLAPDHVLDGVEGISVRRTRPAAEGAQADVSEDLAKLGEGSVTLLGLPEEGFPARLRDIPDPPPLLFVAGTLDRRDELAVGVVGTRASTPYGNLAAERISADLARRGFTIVSGLARGIDQAAHAGALSAGEGP